VLNDDLFVDEQYNYDDSSLKKNIYDLRTKVLVYSNHEETMSFIIEIQFESLKSSRNIKGFELIFQTDDKIEPNCIQIVTIKNHILKYKVS
jgi:hypothetical protein